MRSFNSWIFPQIELMNCFCRMVDRQKVFSLISNWDHCQFLTIAYFRHAASRIQTCFDLSCTEVITTTPRILELHVSIDKCLSFYQMWLLFLFNHGQNICRLFLALARFPFATSESELCYCDQKVYVRAVSCAAKQLKAQGLRKLGNFNKIPEKIGIDGKSQPVTQQPDFNSCDRKLGNICCNKFQRNTYFT